MKEEDIKQQVALNDAILARIKSCPYYCDEECYAIAESGLPFIPETCTKESCVYVRLFSNKLTERQDAQH